jgi:hypothetical protein
MNIELTRGKAIRIRGGAGHVVHAREGSVWITEENSARDWRSSRRSTTPPSSSSEGPQIAFVTEVAVAEIAATSRRPSMPLRPRP